jgi:anti-sigma factor ChrR (cupin superfamily)
VVLDTASLPWLATAAGEWRKPLDRDASVGVTSMVRCAPGGGFNTPDEGQGAEILILEGGLADEQTGYVAGAYLRNPTGVLHTDQGCVLFVRRYPFDQTDSDVVRIDTASAPWLAGRVPGLSVMPLHQHRHEHAALVCWQPETYFQPHAHFGGEEILVLSGVFEDEYGSYPPGSWIRSPHMSRHQPFSRTGCTIYVKTGHLFVMDENQT